AALQKAKDDATSQAELARESLGTLVNRVPEILGDDIYTHASRIEVLRLIDAIRDQLPEEGDSRGTADRGLLGAHLGRAAVYGEQGKPDEADREYQAALELAGQTCADHP